MKENAVRENVTADGVPHAAWQNVESLPMGLTQRMLW
jgi:hypothetical protein